MKIRLFKPYLSDDELDNIKEVFNDAWLGLGPKVYHFEDEWNKYIKSEHSIAVNSGTAALHVALAAYEFPKNKKVLVPAITFSATAAVALYCNLEPVFVDIDKETLTISLSDLEKKYTDDCVAIIPVHFGGQPCDMDKLMDWAKNKGLVVIEDCANCAGGEYKGKKLGTIGDIGCYSFEEKKNMVTGDGGMISTNDIELANKIRPIRWHGIDKDTWQRQKDINDTNIEDFGMHWYYEIVTLGYKYNMNDLMAAIGLAQLKKLDLMNEMRKNAIEKYLVGISNCKTIKASFPYALEKSAYWLFSIRCKKRNELIIFLKNKGIATSVHFMPLTMHPFYKRFDSNIDNARSVYKELITLPLFPGITNSELDYVIDALVEFDKKN